MNKSKSCLLYGGSLGTWFEVWVMDCWLVAIGYPYFQSVLLFLYTLHQQIYGFSASQSLLFDLIQLVCWIVNRSFISTTRLFIVSIWVSLKFSEQAWAQVRKIVSDWCSCWLFWLNFCSGSHRAISGCFWLECVLQIIDITTWRHYDRLVDSWEKVALRPFFTSRLERRLVHFNIDLVSQAGNSRNVVWQGGGIPLRWAERCRRGLLGVLSALRHSSPLVRHHRALDPVI